MQGADIDKLEILAGISGQKDLARDLAAHNPGVLVHHFVRVQRAPQARGPARVINAIAIKPAQIQDVRHKTNRQVPQDAAGLQAGQNVNQPGRIGGRDIQDLDGQDLGGVGVFDKGDVLILPPKDDRVCLSAPADSVCQLYESGPVPSVHNIRIKHDLLARGDRLQLYHLSHEARAATLDMVEPGPIPADEILRGKVDGFTPPLPVLYAHQLILIRKDHAIMPILSAAFGAPPGPRLPVSP